MPLKDRHGVRNVGLRGDSLPMWASAIDKAPQQSQESVDLGVLAEALLQGELAWLVVDEAQAQRLHQGHAGDDAHDLRQDL